MARGRAKLAVSPGLSVWVLEAYEGLAEPDVHTHHAIQITVCLKGRLALIDHERAVTGPLLAVAPDVPHRLDAAGLLGFVFVEPEGITGRRLSTLFRDQPLLALDYPAMARQLERLASAIEGNLSRDEMLAIASAALDTIGTAPPPKSPDPRIERIIAYATLHPGTSLVAAAESVGVFLSESRLRHLFVEQTGLAFKTYMVWQRLVRAVGLYSEGRSLTQSAHEAGFADSAHFSRAFRATFGAPATTLERI